MFAGAGAGAAAGQTELARLEASLLETEEVITPPIHLTKRYRSMEGPTSIKSFQLDAAAGEERVWIKRFKIDVLDGAQREESTEFLCHAWLMADSGLREPKTGQRGARGGRDPSLFLTISQGFEDMHFPPGFAVEFDRRDVSRVGLLTMAVNNNYDDIDRNVRFRATIDYLRDSAARQLGIQPLTGIQLHARQSTSVVMAADHHHSGGASHHAASKTDHWLVPPGRQVLRSDVRRGVIGFDGMIHFIKVHLHPYGESLTLVDKLTGEVVWKGNARNHPERAHLVAVDGYSSTLGIPIHRDRDYELITVYENPTAQPVDAMAVMRIYVHPKDADPSSRD
jgi:hypothetical protein